MALSAKLSGEMLIYIGTDAIGFAKDFDFEYNKETIDVTTLDSNGWKDFLIGLKEWKVSTSGLTTRGTAAASQLGSEDILDDMVDSDAAVTISIKSTESGDQYFTGSAFITSFKESGSVGDAITYSIELQGTGALTLATVS